MVDEGLTLHIFPAKGVAAGRSAMVQAASGSNLIYGGGPVQHNPKIYIVFWGSKWTTSNAEYTRLVKFFNGLSGSQWNNTVTQYYDNSAHIANDATLAGTWIDTSYVPSHPGTSAVTSEAKRAESHFGYQGTDANYWVAIESGHDPSGFKTQWCAWHSSTSSTSGTISFTDFPYQSDAGANCGAGSVNSPGTYDGVTIVGGHEEAETETDPQPSTGWVDSSGSEIGDKCAWTNLQNTSFSTGTFPTQPLWSNSAGGCVQ
jgi:serine protease